jgi:hypothetical protein
MSQRYRLPVTILSSAIDGNLTDFTVVITDEMAAVLSAVDGLLDADGTRPSINGGGDVRFSADELGTQRLAVDVREWITNNNPASGSLEVAVKVPAISAVSDTTIYLWWGKAGETQPAPGDPFGQYAAYDANTVFMSPDGGATSRTAVNPTPTVIGTLNLVAGTGVVGAATEFPGTGYVSLGHQAELNLAGGASTVSVLYRWPLGLANIHGLVSNYDHLSGNRGWLLRINGGMLQWYFQSTPAAFNADEFIQSGETGANDGGWHWLSGTFQGGVRAAAYVDGQQAAARTTNVPASLSTNTSDKTIGNFSQGAGTDLVGALDEIRLSTTARSAAWLKAESTNLLTPASFFSFGDIESP